MSFEISVAAVLIAQSMIRMHTNEPIYELIRQRYINANNDNNGTSIQLIDKRKDNMHFIINKWYIPNKIIQ